MIVSCGFFEIREEYCRVNWSKGDKQRQGKHKHRRKEDHAPKRLIRANESIETSIVPIVMAIAVIAQTEGAEFKVTPVAFNTIAVSRFDMPCLAFWAVPFLRAPECIIEASVVFVTT